MNFGYYLESDSQSDYKLLEQCLIDKGAVCLIHDVDNLESHFPRWLTLLDLLKQGDKLIVSELNDIFLSLIDLLNLFDEFKKKGVEFLSIKENYGFYQENHSFCDVMTIYDEYQLYFDGTLTKKKIVLSKSGSIPKKKRRELSDQSTAKAIAIGEEYLNGNPVVEILEEFGMCYSTFRNHLQHIGIKPDKNRNGKLPGFENEEPIIQNIVRLYEQGLSIAKIQEHYPTLNISRVRKVLVSQGVSIRSKRTN